jgi:hypothetical protein
MGVSLAVVWAKEFNRHRRIKLGAIVVFIK